MSAEFGKHLLEVEDFLQKHKLMEADIAIQGEKVKDITAATLRFTEEKGGHGTVCLLRPLAPDPGLWLSTQLPSLDKSPSFRILLSSSINGVEKKQNSPVIRQSAIRRYLSVIGC